MNRFTERERKAAKLVVEYKRQFDREWAAVIEPIIDEIDRKREERQRAKSRARSVPPPV